MHGRRDHVPAKGGRVTLRQCYLRYDQGWTIAPGDRSCVFVPGVARPMRLWSNERAVLAVRAANTFGDTMEFLRKVRDELVTMDAEQRAELAEYATRLHAEAIRQATKAHADSR